MKRLLSCCAAALLGLGVVLAGASAQELEIIDWPVAVVNEDIILASELHEQVQETYQTLRGSGERLPKEEAVRAEVLEHMILESLQLQLARRGNLRVSDEELNQAMQGVARQNGFGSLLQFRQMLEREGISYERTRERVYRQVLVKKLHERAVGSQVRLTEEDVASFLASPRGRSLLALEYHVTHILFPFQQEEESVQLTRLASQAGDWWREGGDMEVVLDRAAEGRPEGSDLGWRGAEQLPGLLRNVVPQLDPAEVAGPLRSSAGYHLARLEEVRRQGRTVQEVHARHIQLRPTPILEEEQVEEAIQGLHRQLEEGADFARLARLHSDDAETALAGGDLGWLAYGELDAALRRAARQTPPGERSAPFRSTEGWHILEVLEQRERDVSEEIQRQRVSQLLYRRKFDEALTNWLQQIRSEAYVDIRPDPDTGDAS